ncbi:MAG: hypothetical protein J6S57_02545, partial [Alphaproteobacteria bacterium]|nr:hypothetical protein [Alphaproteobacteria bacterium]
MKKETNKHILKIKQLYPDASEIYRPSVLGCIHDIYIVKKDNDKFVFRFSDEQTAIHNLYVSRLLLKNSIPVPNIEIYNMDSEYCEIYPFIEGKTLHEKYEEQKLSKGQIENIYNQLYDICCRLSKIPTKEFDHLNRTAAASDRFFQIMNMAPMVVGHSDLHDKNILVDENNNVFG